MPLATIDLPSLGEILKDSPGWLDEAVDTAEASRIVGFPVCTLHTWRSRGEGPPFLKIGTRSVRYQRRTLFQWLADRQRRNTADDGAIMADKTKPVSIRLARAEIEQLQARAVFLYGFAKNERDNIDSDELATLRKAFYRSWNHDQESEKPFDEGRLPFRSCGRRHSSHNRRVHSRWRGRSHRFLTSERANKRSNLSVLRGSHIESIVIVPEEET